MVPSVAYLVVAYCAIDYFVVVLSCVRKMSDNNKEKLSKCLRKQSEYKRGPRYYQNTEKTVPIGFVIPRASSCAFGNAIYYFCHLAVFLYLTVLF